jgi:hypothetical protein
VLRESVERALHLATSNYNVHYPALTNLVVKGLNSYKQSSSLQKGVDYRQGWSTLQHPTIRDPAFINIGVKGLIGDKHSSLLLKGVDYRQGWSTLQRPTKRDPALSKLALKGFMNDKTL